MSRAVSIFAAGLLALLLSAPAAGAHALVTGTSPERGATLERAPSQVEFDFSEPVETNFGSVRVFDAGGERVDRGRADHPNGAGDRLAIGLEPGLTDGTYTATYRVISSDSHPVSGGFTFSVGDGGPAPGKDVADLLASTGRTSKTTEVAFGVARALGYLAIALAAGGALFVVAVWRPAWRRVAGPDAEWEAAAAGFRRAALRLAVVAVGLGIASSCAGVVLQGATAAGTSAWSALDPDVVGDVLETRFGTVWGLRLAAFAVLGLALLMRGRRGRVQAFVVAGCAAVLVVTPALAGHASSQSPRAVLVASTIAHVAAMSAWVGGLVALLAALPAATRRLSQPDRTRLLAATVARFSPFALAAVALLLATGVLQALLYLDAWSELTSTAFGRAILIKAALLLALVVLGAHNRFRSIPRLERLASGGASPGRAGLLLRRTLRAEVGLLIVVFGVTAALASYSPSVAASTGPFSAQRELGPLELELTVDPARVGRNEIHLYLFRRSDGSQFARAKELAVAARLPGKGIGPLALDARKTGPGHYTVPLADLAPGGKWRLRITVRVSAFDEYETDVEVPIR